MQHLIEQLSRTQGRLAQLMDVTKRASEVSVGSFEAEDQSGSIRIRLAEDGLPESIRLLPGWRNKCGATRLSAAVIAAAQEATGKRMTAWGQALDAEGVTAMMSDLEGLGDDRAASTDWRDVYLKNVQIASDPPRELSVIAEDVLSLLDSFDQTGQGDSIAGSAPDRGPQRSVSIILTEHAMQSCTIDPRWAEHEDDYRIEAAIRSALQEARQDSVMRGAGFRDRSTALVTELMAQMANGLSMVQRASSGGGIH
ncbi:hypothetical protein [Streptacidiphilus sp. MAP5-3]|uniref:hypothetical protein n=1 Tax=unclassified Streptacidiphilus TaxID=2643834 RepID=UPI003516FB69